MENCQNILPPSIAVFFLVLYIDFSKDFKRHCVFECVYLSVRSSIRSSVHPLIGRSVGRSRWLAVVVCLYVRVISDYPYRRHNTHYTNKSDYSDTGPTSPGFILTILNAQWESHKWHMFAFTYGAIKVTGLVLLQVFLFSFWQMPTQCDLNIH